MNIELRSKQTPGRPYSPRPYGRGTWAWNREDAARRHAEEQLAVTSAARGSLGARALQLSIDTANDRITYLMHTSSGQPETCVTNYVLQDGAVLLGEQNCAPTELTNAVTTTTG